MTEVVGRELVISLQPEQPFSAREDFGPAPQASKKAVTAIRNMTYQHQEFQTRLRDVERLWLYAQSVVSDHRALSASLDEAESSSRRWENEAKESVEKIARAEQREILLSMMPRWPVWMPMRLGMPGQRWSPSWLGSKTP